MVFLPDMQNPNGSTRKHQIKIKNILWINWPVFFEDVRILKKEKEKNFLKKNYSRLKDIKWHNNLMQWMILDYFLSKKRILLGQLVNLE